MEGNMQNQTEPETSADGVEYPVTYRTFESLDEAISEMDGGEEAVLENLNSKQRQSALQSPKGVVREAVQEAKEAGHSTEAIQSAVDAWDAGGDEAVQAVLDAIEHHQEAAREYVLGSPRGASGGVNKTTAREVGDRVAEALDRDPDQLRELAEELGVDVSDLL